MKRYMIGAGWLLGCTLLASCSTVPVTGRHQLSLVSGSSMLAMSSQEYGTFLKSNPLSSDPAQTVLVQRVGTNIQHAVERYFRERNQSGALKDYAWEFNLVANDQVNAWCMPGGKVVVYTGILPISQDETGLAVVLGHEIAHAIAEHGRERMSQGLIAQYGGEFLSQAMAQKPEQTRQLWMSVYGAGTQYGALLPYGRLQETEADHLGLIFMAMAGYDPRLAIPFWERMAGQKGKTPPEFLSTHPSDQTRVAGLRKFLPEALGYYR